MGLLTMASNLDEHKSRGLAFSDFIIKHSLKDCAILTKKQNDFLISNSINFDADSIIKSFSTVDFWNGLCNETKKIYNFSKSDNSYTPLLQIFSEEKAEKINTIQLCKNDDGKILLVCNQILNENIIKDFETIDDSNHLFDKDELKSHISEKSCFAKINISATEAVNNLIKAYDLEQSLFEESIYREILNKLSVFYTYIDAVKYLNNGHYKYISVSDKKYSIELIKTHLLLNLKETLGSFSNLVQITCEGYTHNFTEIGSFFQAE